MRTRMILCKGEVRTIEDVVEAWKEAHDQAMSVRHLEDVIRKCVDLKENFGAWHKELWDGASSGTLTEVHSEGETLLKWFDIALTVLAGVEPWITWAEDQEYVAIGAEDYRRAVGEVQRMRDEFSRRWPFFDPKRVEEARTEIARGQFQTAEEILGELQGTHPEQH